MRRSAQSRLSFSVWLRSSSYFPLVNEKAITGDCVKGRPDIFRLASKRKSLARERHGEHDLSSVSGHGQKFASHQFDCWPVLAENVRCVVEIARLHSNTAGLSAGTVRYLKVKIETDCLQLLFDRLAIAAHLVSPHFASRTLRYDLDFRWARLWRAVSETEATGDGCLLTNCSPEIAKDPSAERGVHVIELHRALARLSAPSNAQAWLSGNDLRAKPSYKALYKALI